MIKFEFNGDIVIELYTDSKEWTNEFYPDISKDCIIEAPMSTGFANIRDKVIYIFKRDDCTFEDLLETVSHELGHIVTGGFKYNPPSISWLYWLTDNIHEKKALHYEKFTLTAYSITKELFKYIKE
jgi:hypothetical protein